MTKSQIRRCKQCRYYKETLGYTRWNQKEPKIIRFCSLGHIYKNEFLPKRRRCPSFKRREEQ